MVHSDPGYLATDLYECWSYGHSFFLLLKLLSTNACLPVTLMCWELE